MEWRKVSTDTEEEIKEEETTTQRKKSMKPAEDRKDKETTMRRKFLKESVGVQAEERKDEDIKTISRFS